MVGGGDPFYLKFWVNWPPLKRNRRFWTTAVTAKKNSINTNRKSRMSLWWSLCVAPRPLKGNSKTQNGRFSAKIALRLKKVCYKVSLCENCQRQSCKAFIGKIIGGGRPLVPKILDKTDRVGAKSLLVTCTPQACSDSAVTPNEKSSINTNRKATTRFSISPRWISYVVRKPPSRPKGAQKRKVSKICNNSETVRDRMSVTINH